MKECIRHLCLLSLLFSAAVWLAPEGGAKRIMRIMCSAALLSVVLNSVVGVDFSSYAVTAAKVRERETELTSKGTEFRDRLSRLIIEEEYRTYIVDKAAELGVAAEEVQIGVRWNTEGVWVPERSKIQVKSLENTDRLGALLTVEFGIPVQRQEWILNES